MKALTLIIVLCGGLMLGGCGQTAQTACRESASNLNWLADVFTPHVTKAKERNHMANVKYVKQYFDTHKE